MRAILFEQPRVVRLIDDAPMPVPGDGEVLVQCTHVGLCGSNTGPYLGVGRWAGGEWPRPPGWTGHENVGVIVESRCEAWPVGTKVLAQAKNGRGFAEYIACRPEAMARLPDDTEDMGSLIIAQPLATVLRAVYRIGSVIGERCAVIGLGPIGLMFTYLLRRMGASQVIGIDLVPWRLAWARHLGATEGVDASGENVVEAVRTLTDGAMVDVCVEAAGPPDAYTTAAYLPRLQGRLCLFGVPDDDLQPFPWFYTTDNETEIILSRGSGCRAYFQTAVDMVARDHASIAELVTPRLPWNKAAEAFEMYAHPGAHPGTLKVVLVM
jgi:threonine dehydrogenase-like Zn-dependent dehydrogenase